MVLLVYKKPPEFFRKLAANMLQASKVRPKLTWTKPCRQKTLDKESIGETFGIASVASDHGLQSLSRWWQLEPSSVVKEKENARVFRPHAGWQPSGANYLGRDKKLAENPKGILPLKCIYWYFRWSLCIWAGAIGNVMFITAEVGNNPGTRVEAGLDGWQIKYETPFYAVLKIWNSLLGLLVYIEHFSSASNRRGMKLDNAGLQKCLTMIYEELILRRCSNTFETYMQGQSDNYLSSPPDGITVAKS